MKRFFALLLLVSTVASAAQFKAEYPMGPDAYLTPGALCERPNSYRYPERIAYCNREVDVELKEKVFRDYRQNGYRLRIVDRSDYKIDHLVPLCAGGSNRDTNLWPQHVSLFNLTDPMESLGCDRLKNGKISQNQLVNLIITAKRNIHLVPETINYLRNL